MMRVLTTSAMETRALGTSFADSLRPGDVVALTGTLGSGKTHFVMGVCEGLGAGGHVGSPTFTLVHEYPVAFGSVVHIDLYRLSAERELLELGLEEYFDERHICLIEWPELVNSLLPRGRYKVTLAHGERTDDRWITIEGGRA